MISVIVPIYNVEDYIQRCIESLLAQTFQDVEFICIDDGSTDNSGVILDRYSYDSRICVFHTENHGLGAARNLGIKKSHGDWIMFVDGDDYVDTCFCEIPYNEAVKNNIDIAIFGYGIIKNGRIKTIQRKQNATILISDKYDGYKYGLDLDVTWNKLYRKTLFQGISYPEGRAFEDIATTHKIIHKAKQIGIIQECLYYYTYRKNSISQIHTESNYIDYYYSEKEKISFLKQFDYPEEYINYTMCAPAITLLTRGLYDSELRLDIERILDSIKRIPQSLSSKQKIALMIWKVNKRLFFILSKVMGRNSLENTFLKETQT